MTYLEFELDADGFPVPGTVVRYYRRQMMYTDKYGHIHTWTQAHLAELLSVSERTVRDMESQNKYLDSVERRKLLSKLMNIPPVLLGLASIDQINAFIETSNISPITKTSASKKTVSLDNVQLYQNALPVFKDAYDNHEHDTATL